MNSNDHTARTFRLSRRRMLSGLGLGGAAAGLGGILSGCSTAPEGFTQQPAPSSGGGPGTAAKLSGEVVIAINSNPSETVRNALTAEYNKVQPDVKLTWLTKDFGGADAYVSYLGTQLAAGDIKLDLVSGNYLPTFGQYVSFEEVRSEPNPYTGNAWEADYEFDFNAPNAAGRLVNVATQSVHISWYYNQSLMDRAGAAPPTTWTEFTEVCAKVAAAGLTPLSINYSYQMPQWLTSTYFDQYHTDWVQTVRAQEGDWNFNPAVDGSFVYDANTPELHSSYTYNQARFFAGIQDGTLRFDTDRVADIVDNLVKVFPRYATQDFFVLEDNYASFLSQQSAMMYNGSWSLPTLEQDLASLAPERLEELGLPAGSIEPFEWATFENPTMEGDLVQSNVRAVESASGDYISVIDRGPEQTAVSLDFAKFWLSAAGYQTYMDTAVEAGEWEPSGQLQINGLDEPPVNDVFSSMQMLGNAEANYNSFWLAGQDATQQTDLRNLLKDALEAKLSPTEYASALQTYVTEHLDDSLEAASLTRADIDNPARRPAGR